MDKETRLAYYDYKLLKAIAERRITKTGLLQGSNKDCSVTNCRYERLVAAGMVQKQNDFIVLTPLGKTELEDFLKEESDKKLLEKRSELAVKCSIASTVAAIGSAACAVITLLS